MQTFLPYPSFIKSAKVLDRQRLGKQRVECLQILKAISDPEYGWQNHPATKMWRANPQALCHYAEAICLEWISRGYRDTCLNKISEYYLRDQVGASPSWLGNVKFHSSHRAALLFKNPEHYGKFQWSEKPKLDYVWPVS